jgi:hypothetical protein
MHTCPVCGYNQLIHPPIEGTICPSCYTEFGYDDVAFSYPELRARWLANGPQWEGVNVMPIPVGWNPFEQLKNLQPTGGSVGVIRLGGHQVSTQQVRLLGMNIRLVVGDMLDWNQSQLNAA